MFYQESLKSYLHFIEEMQKPWVHIKCYFHWFKSEKSHDYLNSRISGVASQHFGFSFTLIEMKEPWRVDLKTANGVQGRKGKFTVSVTIPTFLTPGSSVRTTNDFKAQISKYCLQMKSSTIFFCSLVGYPYLHQEC